MGNPTRKKTKSRKDSRRFVKAKRTCKVKDIDAISDDLKSENFHKLLHQELDHDLPGSAQFYCVHCARYFIEKKALLEHFRTKRHKRRLKELETEPYSQAEAERAAGLGNFQLPKKRKIETQPIEEEMFDINKEDKVSS